MGYFSDFPERLRTMDPWRRPAAIRNFIIVLGIVVGLVVLGVLVVTGGVWSVSEGFEYLGEHGLAGLDIDLKEAVLLAFIGVGAAVICGGLAVGVRRQVPKGSAGGATTGLYYLGGVFIAFWTARLGAEEYHPWDRSQEEAEVILRAVALLLPVSISIWIGIRRADKAERREAERLREIDIQLWEEKLQGFRAGLDEDERAELDELLKRYPDGAPDDGYIYDDMSEYPLLTGYYRIKGKLDQLYQERLGAGQTSFRPTPSK